MTETSASISPFGNQKFAEGETPESSGLRRHLFRKYYVAFNKAFKTVKELMSEMNSTEDVENMLLLIEAQEMLKKWEARI